ncbi:MAG: Uma2 family endonuclease [Chloroflexi bacterium]|nr:Uma2 family endonuclease [Chloroflexota bacterium]
MAETGYHVTLIAYFLAMLRSLFRDRKDVYVGANMLMYYREDDPRRSVAPDVFVVFGVPGHERRVWKVWEEGKGPDVVFEFTSRSTRDEDLGSKKGLYEWMGVREYFLFDPLGEYLKNRLQGHLLTGDGFHPILPAGEKGLPSEYLGVYLRLAGDELQMFRRDSGERLLPPPELALVLEEAEERLEETQGRLEEEASARRAAEAEVARLREELQRLRRQGA